MTANAPATSGESLADSRGTLAFFVVAYGITWLLQLPAVLALRGILPGPPERFLILVGLGAFGPLLAAVLVSRLTSGRAGVRALFRALGIWRVGSGWYVVALGFFAVVYVAGAAVYALGGGNPPLRWLYPPENGARIAAMVVFAVGEEPGWRGFALPRLQARHGVLKASLLVGVGWGLWHVPMFLLAGLTPGLFLLSFVNILAGSVAFSWIYNHTRGSLLIAILTHVGAHLCNPAQVLPGNPLPFAVFTAALCVVAVGLVLVDRRVWRATDATR